MTDNMTENGQSGAALYAKMARIMGELRRLPKSGYNQHFKYNFVTDSDVADTIRELLAKENIAFFAEIVNVEQDGKRTKAAFIFTFACGDTGATRSCSWVGEADDTGDKGVSKAATLGEKYFLLKTFVCSTGDERDDPDADAHLNGQAKKQAQKAPTTPASASNGDGQEPPKDKPEKSAVGKWHNNPTNVKAVMESLAKETNGKIITVGQAHNVLADKTIEDFATGKEFANAVFAAWLAKVP